MPCFLCLYVVKGGGVHSTKVVEMTKSATLLYSKVALFLWFICVFCIINGL